MRTAFSGQDFSGFEPAAPACCLQAGKFFLICYHSPSLTDSSLSGEQRVVHNVCKVF
jgi:hypothetical protein